MIIITIAIIIILSLLVFLEVTRTVSVPIATAWPWITCEAVICKAGLKRDQHGDPIGDTIDERNPAPVSR